MIEGLLFDLDGVIIDSGADIARAVQHTLELFHQPVLPMDEIIDYVGDGASALIRRSFKHAAPDLIEKALLVYLQYYYAHSLIETKLYPHVEATLKTLRRNRPDIKMALVTNKPEAVSEKILAGLGVMDCFDQIVGPESVHRLKPDPEGILRVLRVWNLSAGKAIMIGDSSTDIQAGKAAGTITCGVTYGLGDKEALTKARADYMIDDLAQLLELIDGFGSDHSSE